MTGRSEARNGESILQSEQMVDWRRTWQAT